MQAAGPRWDRRPEVDVGGWEQTAVLRKGQLGDGFNKNKDIRVSRAMESLILEGRV